SQPQILGAIDYSHPATAQPLQNAEVPDRLADEFRARGSRLSSESVPAPGDRLDIAGSLGGLRERLAQALNRRVYSVADLHHRVVRPKPAADALPQHNLSGALQQEDQQPQRLLLQANDLAVPAQLAGANIQFERSEPDLPSASSRGSGHAPLPAQPTR